MKEIFRDVEAKMKHAVDHFHAEMKHLRTGRASTSLLDGLVVDYYGTPTPIAQVANLSVADATMLVAQPWDPKQIAGIEKAIRASDLGLNPTNDGKLVRIPVPPLNEDRRKELVKKAHDSAEHGRNAVRLARREGNDKMKTMLKDKKIGEDEERRGLEEVQKLHDHYIADINKALEHKEKDILTV
jgi:ribosome recycling factor